MPTLIVINLKEKFFTLVLLSIPLSLGHRKVEEVFGIIGEETPYAEYAFTFIVSKCYRILVGGKLGLEYLSCNVVRI